jgi:cysteine synthase A
MNKPHTNLFREISKRPTLLEFLKGQKSLSLIFDLIDELEIDRKEIFKQLYKKVGNTPVHKVDLGNNNSLHIKLECNNKMGNNHYSRYWLIHLALAEAFKIIAPNKTKIIEVTSGSSGISLSLACEQLGYDLTMIVPKSLPKGRTKPIINAGATVIKADGYIDACIDMLRNMLSQDNYYAANHSEEKSNLITYVFSRMASEYISTCGSPDAAVLGLGNGTSTEAAARTFKETSISTKIYSYYPDFDSKQIVFGLFGPNVELRHVPNAKKLVDKMFYTSEGQIKEVKELFKNDKIILSLGISSLYAIAFVIRLSKTTKNLTYYSIGYDKIERYAI